MLKRCGNVMAILLVAYGCAAGGEQRIAALEQRVSTAEAKIKKLEGSAVPRNANTQELGRPTVNESGVASQSQQVLANTQPTPEYQPSAQPSTPLVTQTLSGTGKTATRLLTFQEGLYVFRLTHSGTSNFIVHLLDRDGHSGESLVNEVGAFSGSKAIRIPKTGQYVLDVDADGAWTIVAGPP